MNFFSRAFKNVSRKLSKSILILITFFVIGNFVIVGLGISNASTVAKEVTRKSMRAVVTYEVDYNAYYEYAESIEDEDERNDFYENHRPQITQATLDEFLSDSRVKTINATTTEILYAVGFDHVLIGNEEDKNGGGVVFNSTESSASDMLYQYVDPNIQLIGNVVPDMIEFGDGIYTLVEGRFYTQEEIDNSSNVALITDTLAEQNGLSIGDTIKISSISESDIAQIEAGTHPWYTSTDLEYGFYELEIIGIFDNSNEIDPSADNYDWMSPFESPENIILAPSTTIINKRYEADLSRWEENAVLYPDDEYFQDPNNIPTIDDYYNISKATILLNDPLDVETFYDEYTLANTSDYFFYDANNEEFDRLSKPLDTMSLYANFIVYIVLFNAIIIITLVTALTLKTREYEIGVLLALGVSKAKVISQFFVELAIIALLGFTLSVVSGSLIAGSVGNSLLEYTISTSDDLEDETDDNFYYYGNVNYFTEITLDDMLAGYDVTISPLIIGQIYIAGLGIVLLSIIIPSLMIMRFNPKRILTNTN